MVVEPSGRLLDGRTLGVDLEWRCAHETAATILDRIAGRAERTGDLALATAARALTLTLPLEDDSRDLPRPRARTAPQPPQLALISPFAIRTRPIARGSTSHSAIDVPNCAHSSAESVRSAIGAVVRAVSSHCAAR